MARPRKEGMDYFPHDTNATNDKKIEALRMLYGNNGYAFYFILLEMIYQEPTFELDVSDAETIQILSKKVGINTEVFDQILQTAIKRDCFDKESYYERRVLTSNGIKKRAAVVVEKRDKMRISYEKKVSAAEIPPETPQSKEKKSKRKADIKKHYAETVLLTEEEYQKLVSEHGEEFTQKCITVLDNYKAAKGAKYKSDYRAILNWVISRVKDDERKANITPFNRYPSRPTKNMPVVTNENSPLPEITPEKREEMRALVRRLKEEGA